MKKAIFSALIFQFCWFHKLFAQTGSPDFMRSVGKIYVVVAVIVTVFIGIVLFLIYLDRRLTKLENQIIEHDQNDN